MRKYEQMWLDLKSELLCQWELSYTPEAITAEKLAKRIYKAIQKERTLDTSFTRSEARFTYSYKEVSRGRMILTCKLDLNEMSLAKLENIRL